MSFELSVMIRVAVVLILAGGLVLILRNRVSAATRHATWTIGLSATLALPIASLVLPKLDLPVLPRDSRLEMFSNAFTIESNTAPVTAVFVPATAATLPASFSQRSTVVSPWTTRQWFLLAWSLGTLFVALRSLIGAWEVSRLWRNSSALIDENWQRLLGTLQESLAVHKPVELRIANGPVPPMTWGVLRPVILMPASADTWMDSRRRLVLAHELSHVKRNDGFTHIVAQLACSIYWMNPLVWFAATRIRIERERACDDHVLSLGGSPSDYADHLLQIARTLNSGFSFATVSMAHPSQLETRLVAILNPLAHRKTLSRLATILLMACIGVLTVSTAALQLTALTPMVIPSWSTGFSVLAAVQAPQSIGVSAAVTQNQRLASVSGSVFKLGSGEPLPETRVELVKFPATTPNPSPYNTTTGVNGKFVFLNVEPGEYRLVATRNDGFLPAEYGQKKPNVRGLTLTARAGEALKDLSLPMAPPGSVSGRIRDRDGEPVGQAQVQALRTFYREGQRMMTIVQSVQTNDFGEYRLFWLAPGEYYITAKPVDTGGRIAPMYIRRPEEQFIHDETSAPVIHRRVLPSGEIREEIYEPTYFPGTSDFGTAKGVAVRSGDELRGMDISLVAAVPARRIRGVVIDGATGQPVAGAGVRAITRKPTPNVTIPNAVADPKGQFEITGASPGSYDLFAYGGGTNVLPTGAVGLLFIEVGALDLQNLTISLPQAFDLRGRFILEGKSDLDLTRLRVNIRRDPEIFGMPLPQAQTRAGEPDRSVPKPDGSFTLTGLGPGDFRTGVFYMGMTTNGGSINLPTGTYLKSLRLGTRDVLAEGLHLESRPPEELEVTIGTSNAGVTGSVVTIKNEAVPNSVVVLVPDPLRRYRSDLYRAVASDTSGRFEFKGVPPGDYKLFAWDDVQSGVWLDPEFLKGYESLGTPMRITELSRENRQLTVIPAQK